MSFFLFFFFFPLFSTNPILGVFKMKINFLLIVISQLERPIVIFFLFLFFGNFGCLRQLITLCDDGIWELV